MSPREAYLEIYVTPHARLRARERFPGFKAARIVDEVRDAFRARRVATDPPAGIHQSASAHPNALWLWTPDGERVYAVELDEFYTDRFVVVTTLSAEKAAA